MAREMESKGELDEKGGSAYDLVGALLALNRAHITMDPGEPDGSSGLGSTYSRRVVRRSAKGYLAHVGRYLIK